MAKKKKLAAPPVQLPGFEWMNQFTSSHFEEAFESRNKLRHQLRTDDSRAEAAVCLDEARAGKLALVAYSHVQLPSKFEGYTVIDGGIKS